MNHHSPYFDTRPRPARRIRFRWVLLAVLCLVALFTYWDYSLRVEFERCNASAECRMGR